MSTSETSVRPDDGSDDESPPHAAAATTRTIAIARNVRLRPTPADGSPYAAKVQRPASMTTVPPVRDVRNTASPSPVTHMSTVRSSPGNTGEENRASIERKRAGSEPHSACNRARPVNPYEQRPWRIGRSKPPIAANFGSECSGLRSPDNRYTSAWSRSVVYVTVWSGSRSGGTLRGPDGPRSPPNPPSPRMNAEDR